MRILAVADVYEALTSARPYRAAYTSARALAVLRAEAPRRLDEDAVGALEALLGDGLDARPEPAARALKVRGRLPIVGAAARAVR